MTTKLASELVRGDRLTYRDVEVTILDEPEEKQDLFGRDAVRVWARREDMGGEGWMLFGPDAKVEVHR